MPANRHVRFGGGPHGKGPANSGHLAARPTQQWVLPIVLYAQHPLVTVRSADGGAVATTWSGVKLAVRG